jgi:hypothetical protein
MLHFFLLRAMNIDFQERNWQEPLCRGQKDPSQIARTNILLSDGSNVDLSFQLFSSKKQKDYSTRHSDTTEQLPETFLYGVALLQTFMQQRMD